MKSSRTFPYILGTVIACIAFLSLTPGSGADSAKPLDANCRLVQVASLDIDTQQDGTISVPAAINDHDVHLLVDTGSITSSVSAETVHEFGLRPTVSSRHLGEFMNGMVISQVASIDSFKLGSLYTRESQEFVVLPEGMMEPSVYGMLGPDIMHNYDVEFDFYRGKFNVFEPHNCDNAVVYWTNENYAQLPMKVDRSRHIVTSATLDGMSVTVIVDSGSATSFMSLDAARQLFGWEDKDLSVKLLTASRINNGRPVQIYDHAFGLLDLGGVAVKNPKIALIQGQYFPGYYRNVAQIVLGLDVLRQLHMLVGYERQSLYLTSAEAKFSDAPPTPATPSTPGDKPAQH